MPGHRRQPSEVDCNKSVNWLSSPGVWTWYLSLIVAGGSRKQAHKRVTTPRHTCAVLHHQQDCSQHKLVQLSLRTTTQGEWCSVQGQGPLYVSQQSVWHMPQLSRVCQTHCRHHMCSITPQPPHAAVRLLPFGPAVAAARLAPHISCHQRPWTGMDLRPPGARRDHILPPPLEQGLYVSWRPHRPRPV